jgi:hypothetical protein
VNAPNNISVDQSVFRQLEKNIIEFYNSTQWTNDIFEPNEKIEGIVNITVTKETGPNAFVIDLLFKTRRPVYKSSYSTTMLNYLERGVQVNYEPGQAVIKSEVSYVDNLSSILTYYAYIMLGYDYDSFSAFGGEEYYLKARNIISSLPPNVATSSGWDSRGGIVGRNRYWLQENLLSPKMKPYRQFFYDYHRFGIDELYNDPDRQRAVLASNIATLQTVINDYPNSMILQMFSDSKKEEIVDIFKVADRGQKKKVYDIMIQCDPARSSEYKVLSR